MAHHVITGIERRGDAMRRSLNHADAETRDVARHHTDARADGLSRDRAGLVRTGVTAGAAGGKPNTRCHRQSRQDEAKRFHNYLSVFGPNHPTGTKLGASKLCDNKNFPPMSREVV